MKSLKVTFIANCGEPEERKTHIYIDHFYDSIDSFEELKRILLENNDFLCEYGEISILETEVVTTNEVIWKI